MKLEDCVSELVYKVTKQETSYFSFFKEKANTNISDGSSCSNTAQSSHGYVSHKKKKKKKQ